MKRYTHAWIALRAIDRLSQFENNMKVETQRNSIKNLQAILRDREFAKLVVQGTWVPDNVIKDNSQGHIWKYTPPLRNGEESIDKTTKKLKGIRVVEGNKTIYYKVDHAKTSSLCYQEAQKTYAWNKPWYKNGGFLADRCEAVHQAVRDMFLFQQDEMRKIAATLIVRFGGDLYNNQQEVIEFLTRPEDKVKVFYDSNRKDVVALRNKIGCKGYAKVTSNVKKCVEAYRPQITEYISKSNGTNLTLGKPSYFPMFFTDAQIILSLFTLSHYLADAHMPLHADAREFSDDDCGNIHGRIEEEWENWVISPNDQANLRDTLSETERAEKFINLCSKETEEDLNWRNFRYPHGSMLEEFDQTLGEDIWDNRDIKDYGDACLWDETVGVTYASYCLASRLLAFNDRVRNVPKGSEGQYKTDFNGTIKGINGDDWKTAVQADDIGKGFKDGDVRKKIYDFAVAKGGDVAFNYLSLLILVDAVDCVAKSWGKIVEDYLNVTY